MTSKTSVVRRRRGGTLTGFSLIEMMVVLVIIGIVTAFAYPSYTKYLLRAGRSEAAATLLEVMERQELFYRNSLTYAATLSQLGYSTDAIETETDRYSVTASTCTGLTIVRCVKLTATAQKSQIADGNITLNSRGVKSNNWPGQQ